MSINPYNNSSVGRRLVNDRTDVDVSSPKNFKESLILVAGGTPQIANRDNLRSLQGYAPGLPRPNLHNHHHNR